MATRGRKVQKEDESTEMEETMKSQVLSVADDDDNVEAEPVRLGRVEVLEDPLRARGKSRLAREMRARVGFHQVWKHPDEVDDAKEVGYRFVRENKGDEKVGKESGPLVKIERNGKDELLLMEVEQWKFEHHKAAIAAESQSRFKNSRGDFRGKVEEANSYLDRGSRMSVLDESTEA